MNNSKELLKLSNKVAKGIISTVSEVFVALAVAVVLLVAETIKFMLLVLAFVVCVSALPLLFVMDLFAMTASKFVNKKAVKK